jgi:hypothetical protein
LLRYLKAKSAVEPPVSMSPSGMNDWFETENSFLEKQIRKVASHDDRKDINFDSQIAKCNKALEAVAKQNKAGLHSLKSKILASFPDLNGEFLISHPETSLHHFHEQERQSLELNTQRHYLRQQIYKLELRQIADSVKRVGRKLWTDTAGIFA